MTALQRACVAAVLLGLCGCASTRAGFDAGLDVAGESARGALQGAGEGAVGGMRVLLEARCQSRDCWAMVPVAAGLGAVLGGLAGALNGLQSALERRREPKS